MVFVKVKMRYLRQLCSTCCSQYRQQTIHNPGVHRNTATKYSTLPMLSGSSRVLSLSSHASELSPMRYCHLLGSQVGCSKLTLDGAFRRVYSSGGVSLRQVQRTILSNGHPMFNRFPLQPSVGFSITKIDGSPVENQLWRAYSSVTSPWRIQGRILSHGHPMLNEFPSAGLSITKIDGSPMENQLQRFHSSVHSQSRVQRTVLSRGHLMPNRFPWLPSASPSFTKSEGSPIVKQLRRAYSSVTSPRLPQRKILSCRHPMANGSPWQPSAGFSITNLDGTPIENQLTYIPTPVELTYELLEYYHDGVGLSWCLAIVAATLLYRGLLVFPLGILQQRVFAGIENAQPEINAAVEQVKQQLALKAKEESWSKAKHQKELDRSVKLVIRSLHHKHGCFPIRLSYVALAQFPCWVTVTMALGQMSGWYPEFFYTETDIDILPSLATGGALWFTDLMQSDIGIPIMLGLVNLALVELWSLRKGPLSRMQDRFHNLARVAAVGSMPVAAMMPSVISFYWLVSSLLGLGQFALLRVPSIRRFLEIPQAPSEMRKPLTEMTTALRIRYLGKKVF